jgi:tetratricopeptide (TPR) repeat protein
MDQWLVLIVALAIISLAVTALLLWQRFRLPAKPPAPTSPSNADLRDTTTISTSRLGEERPGPERYGLWSRIGQLPLWQSLLLGSLLLALLVVSTTLVFSLGAPGRYDRLVVLVAPFEDGGDGQTGRNVANALVELLNRESQRTLDARFVDSRPIDSEAALALANANDADLLLWGSVAPGAVLDSASLRPQLIYTPQGPLTPNSWQGYTNRFVMPRNFVLTDQPLNGAVVMPPLLTALSYYNRGNADLAFDTLGQLADNYALNPPLPRAIRGNLLWARGVYEQAAAEYRLALSTPAADQAALANNLGAILLDGRDPATFTALSEAVRLLEGRDLGALRYNLGLQALQNRNYAEAISNLEQARNLLAADGSLYLALAEAYRETGRLDAAQAMLDAADLQIPTDDQLVTVAYRTLANQRIRALMQEQRVLLGFAQLLNARGQLEWWLENSSSLSSGEINRLRDQIRGALNLAQNSVAGWRQRAASEAAASTTGLVAEGQAERTEAQIERHRYYQVLLQIEADRIQLNRGSGPGQFFSAILSGGLPMAESRRQLNELIARLPNDPTLYNAYGRALRLGGDFVGATQRYDQAIAIAPQRPEGYHGKGMISLDLGDPNGARAFFNQAIERDAAFFPARAKLAYLDEGAGDIAGAIANYRDLYARQPGPETAVDLARVLRKNGPNSYTEAVNLLTQYSSTSSAALIELGYLYRAAQRPDQALLAFQNALLLDDASPEANYELGEILVENGDLVGAEARFRAAINSDERNIDARLALALLYQGGLNRPRDAVEQYRAILRIGTANPELSLSIGDVLIRNDAPNYALEAYNQAVRQRPNDPAIHLKLAQTHLILNELNATVASAEQVLNLTPDLNNAGQLALRAEALIALGDVELRANQPQRAIERYNQALSLAPQSLNAVLGLGKAAVGQGNWGVALGYFERANGLPGGSSDANTQFWLAEALLRNNALPRAIETYNRSLQLQPVFPEALLGLAQARYGLGDRPGAEETVNQALNQRAAYAEALLFKGKLQQEQGQIDQAIATFGQSISANSRIAETYFRRGVLYIRKTDYNRAISDLRRSTELQPGMAEAFYWLGRSYYAVSTNQQALEAFKRAVALQPGYTEARYYQGLVEEDLGQRNEAAASYQAVIAADGSGQWGARSKAQLDQLR